MVARTGIAIAILQLAFALTWVVYVAYLPQLAAQVGISKTTVPWILLVDQAIFVACDWAAGMFADRMGDAVTRLGRWIAVVTLVSCAAFVGLPLVAPGGSAALFVGLVLVWSVTSSMLRAPPLALAGRFASRPQRASLAGLYTFGLGASGAMAPYLAKPLATTDPRIPFVAASVVVALMTVVLVAVVRSAAAVAPASPEPTRPISLAPFAVALGLLAIGFQIHIAIDSAPIYLRHATKDQLTDLLPVFWIGFNLAVLPATLLARSTNGLVVAAGAAVIGAAAALVVEIADSLTMLVVAQGFAGAAWSGIMCGVLAAATSSGRRPGTATGLVFSMLALAAVGRIAFVASGHAATPSVVDVTPIAPPVAWALGALVLAVLAVRRGR